MIIPISKLKTLKINGKVLLWIKIDLKSRIQTTQLDEKISKGESVATGAPLLNLRASVISMLH